MSVAPTPLWSTGPEPSLLASRDLASGELVFPPFAENSPLAARHETTPIPNVGIVYSYRTTSPWVRERIYLVYGATGLFLMGLGIRAMLVAKT